MEVGTAITVLTSNYKYKPEELHEYLRLYAQALNCISGGFQSNILRNIVSILINDTIIIIGKNGEEYGVKSLPHRRRLLYKYLQQYDFRRGDGDLVQLLHTQLLENMNIENDICEILKILKVLYAQQLFFSQRYYLLQVIQKISFSKDKRTDRHMSEILERLLSSHFSNDEKDALVSKLFELCNFGVTEFLIANTLFKVAKDIWQHSHIYKLMKYVMQGFADNNLAFAASILFNTMVELANNEYANLVIQNIKHNFQKPLTKCSRTLTQSFTKYIVPALAKKHQSLLFSYTMDMHLAYRLIICKHIFIAKRFLKNRNILTNIIIEASRSEDKQIVAEGFQLLCQFHSRKSPLTIIDVKLFRKMVVRLPEVTPPITRSIRQFISQITVSYLDAVVFDNFLTHKEFYRWLFEFIHANTYTTGYFADIVVELFCFAMEVLVKPSSCLTTHYFLPPLYDQNPLYAHLFRKCGHYFYYNVVHCFKTFMQTTKDVPVVENCLKRILYQTLDEDMIFIAYHHFFDILPLNMPWSTTKCVKLARILINSLVHTRRLETITIFREMISKIINEKVERFRNPIMDEDVSNFAIFPQIEVLTILMENPSLCLLQDYITYGQTATSTITQVIALYGNYIKRDFGHLKFFKKNMERTLISLVTHTFSSAKLSGYPERFIGSILNMVSEVINHVPMKKLIISTCQQFYELVRATPTFKDNFIDFYNAQKAEYLEDIEDIDMILRHSAGVRNLLHVLLKGVDKPYFLESEIIDLLLDVESETIDKLNLKINLLECLVSDGELKQRTKDFVLPVFDRALNLLNHRSAIIKNSSIQLVSVITTRLLGPLSESGVRELSASDIFVVYPYLSETISHHLFNTFSAADVKICILGFLSESNQNGHLYNLRCPFELDRLRMLFTDEQLCNSAITAYVACVPSNRLYDTIARLFEEMDFGKENLLRLSNEVELVTRLSNRYVQAYPDSTKSGLILAELDKMLYTWNNISSREFPADNDDISSNSQQVNYNYLLGLLIYVNKYISNKISAQPSVFIQIIESLLKFLLNAENIPIEFTFCARDVAVNILTNAIPTPIKNTQSINPLKPFSEADINIQELYLIFICKKQDLDENDFIVINDILQNCLKIFGTTYKSVAKTNTVINIMENISGLVFTNNISMVNYLLILCILTYVLENSEKLSRIYYYLTAGHITVPKVGLFVILNNLELYIDDTILQKELLIKCLEFINQPVDFNYSYVYCDPGELMERINFQMKLSENVLYLLHLT